MTLKIKLFCDILTEETNFERIFSMADGRYEYIVKKNTSLMKMYLIIGYILFPIAAVILLYRLLYGSFLVIPGYVMIAGVEVLLIFFSWRFTHVEYESSIEYSTLAINTIRARSMRKISLEVDIKSFTEIGLFTPEASEALEGRTLHKDYIFISSMESENIYYGIFSEGEEQCALYFETTSEAYAYIKKINSSAARRAEINQKRGQNA